MINPPDTIERLRRLRTGAAVVGIAGFAGSIAGAFVAPVELQRALLISFLYWVGASLGSLALLMIHHLTGGRWGFTVQRLLEAALRPLPWLAALFLVFTPVVFGLGDLFPWARSDAGPNAWFLTPGLFWLRFAGYFAVWIALSQLLTRWSARQDATGDPRYGLRMRALSGPGLLAYGLLASFASVDWMMSLTPDWFSSIYTLFFLVSQALTAMAVALGLLCVMALSPSWAHVASRETYRRLGTLLLVFVLLWAYMAYSQYLIIWSGDLTHEISWYLARQHAGWRTMALILVVIHLAVPFAILAFRRTKESAAILRWTCGLLLVARFVDLEWLVTPAQWPNGFHIHWLDGVTFAAVGGAWLAIALGWLVRQPLLPTGDARFALPAQLAEERG